MPGGDKTGPEGKGPATGWRLGSCKSGEKLGQNTGRGLGRGRVMGRGRGLGRLMPWNWGKEETRNDD